MRFSKADRLSRIEKWDSSDKNHPCNQKFIPLKDFKGISGKFLFSHDSLIYFNY